LRDYWGTSEEMIEPPQKIEVDNRSNLFKKLDKLGIYLVPVSCGIFFVFITLILVIIGLIFLGIDSVGIEGLNTLIAAIYTFVGGVVFILLGYFPYRISKHKTGIAIIDTFEKLKNLDLSKNRGLREFNTMYNNLMTEYPEELAIYMRENIDMYRESSYLSRHVLNRMLHSLALKLGYNHMNEMLKDTTGLRLVKLTELKERERKTKKVMKDEIDLSIPITKVYFIDKTPKDEKCMVSGLPIDIKNDVVVACPNCGNMAERELLEKWLKENEKCPVCKKSLVLADFPIVILEV